MTMHSDPAPPGEQTEARTCAYCRALFRPVRPQQQFCSRGHQTAYHVDFGTQGTVASVRKINRGASVVIHLVGPAAERALKLELREVVRVVRKP